MNIQEYKTKSSTGFILKGAYIGTDKLTGKQVRTDIRARTKKGVKNEFDRLKSEFRKNGCIKREKSMLTFEDVANSWFDTYSLGVKPQTARAMRLRLKTYLFPEFGKLKIDRVTPQIVQTAVNKWAKNAAKPPVNGNTVHHKGQTVDVKIILSTLNRICKYALTVDLIDINPCDKVTRPRIKKSNPERVKYLDKEQISTFFSYVDYLPNDYTSELMKALCRLLVASGLRVGEALALNWSDIDLNEQTVSVNKTLSGKEVSNTPKTESSKRVVIIDTAAINRLKRWQLYQKRAMLEVGQPNQPLVFPRRKGGLHSSSTLSVYLKKYLSDCELPHVGWHAFRHTHASLCLNAGVDYKELQARLGHSSIKMTLDIYSHLAPEKEKAAAELVAKYANF